MSFLRAPSKSCTKNTSTSCFALLFNTPKNIQRWIRIIAFFGVGSNNVTSGCGLQVTLGQLQVKECAVGLCLMFLHVGMWFNVDKVMIMCDSTEYGKLMGDFCLVWLVLILTYTGPQSRENAFTLFSAIIFRMVSVVNVLFQVFRLPYMLRFAIDLTKW